MFINIKSQNPAAKNGFIVFEMVRILIESDMLVLEWKSSTTADSYADSVLSTILRIDSNASRMKKVTTSGEEACKAKFNKQLGVLLESMYGGNIEETEEERKFLIPSLTSVVYFLFLDVLKLSLDDKTVIIDKLELRAMCEEDSSLEESVTESIHRLYGAVMPIPTQKII